MPKAASAFFCEGVFNLPLLTTRAKARTHFQAANAALEGPLFHDPLLELFSCLKVWTWLDAGGGARATTSSPHHRRQLGGLGLGVASDVVA